MDKSACLLPLQANGQVYDLDELVLPEGFPSDLNIVNTGMKIGGGPVGTEQFVRDFSTEVLEHFEERITALPGMNPQVGFGLLRVSVSSAPVHLAQLAPPLLTHDLFEHFDDRMVECGFALLTLPGQDEPKYSAERRRRAKQRLTLPFRHKGAGIVSIGMRHALAYFSSVAVCAATDDDLAAHIGGLRRFAADTHQRLLACVGPRSQHTKDIENILCRDNPEAMLDTAHFKDLLMKREDSRLQRPLTHAAHAVQAEALHRELSTAAGEEATADLVAACSADRGHLIFCAQLSDRYNRLTPSEFVGWTRRYLQLPPLMRLGNAAPREGFSYEMEACLGTHTEARDSWLDLHGGHDNSNCAPTMHGKHKGHTLLKYVIHRFAGMVPGVKCVVEPETHDVLLNQFSKTQCRKLFPKKPSKKRSKEIKAVVDELEVIEHLPQGNERDSKYRAIVARMDVLNTANIKEEKKAVRLDVQLQHGTDELLVDVTIVHSLTKANKQAEAKRTWERLYPISSL